MYKLLYLNKPTSQFQINGHLEYQFLILAYQNLNVSTFTTQESSFENWLETVNLPLSGTQYYCLVKIVQLAPKGVGFDHLLKF